MIRLEELLKQTRIRKGLTLEQTATATRIKSQFLDAIERGAYNELPSPAYAKGFVRNYAAFLGLPKVKTSALFKRDFDEKRAVKVLPEGMTATKSFSLKRVEIRRVGIAVLMLAAFLVFLLFQTRDMFIAPSIDIKSPKDGSVVAKDTEVVGKTSSSATVTVNNQEVFVDKDGNFSKKISLFPGKTAVTIKAKNRLNLKNIKILNLTAK